MAKTVRLMGATYEDVPSVVLPTPDGGQARFIEESEAGGGNVNGTFFVVGTYSNSAIASQDKSFAEISAAATGSPRQYPVYMLSGYSRSGENATYSLFLPLIDLKSDTAIFGGSYPTVVNNVYTLRHVSVIVTASTKTVVDFDITSAEGSSF